MGSLYAVDLFHHMGSWYYDWSAGLLCEARFWQNGQKQHGRMQTWPPAGMVIERTWPWGLPPPGLRSSRTALWLSAYDMDSCLYLLEPDPDKQA